MRPHVDRHIRDEAFPSKFRGCVSVPLIYIYSNFVCNVSGLARRADAALEGVPLSDGAAASMVRARLITHSRQPPPHTPPYHRIIVVVIIIIIIIVVIVITRIHCRSHRYRKSCTQYPDSVEDQKSMLTP